MDKIWSHQKQPDMKTTKYNLKKTMISYVDNIAPLGFAFGKKLSTIDRKSLFIVKRDVL